MKLKLLISTILAIVLSQNAFAGTGLIQVKIERVAVISNVPVLPHLAGNMEIKIKNGFTPPAGVNCDTNFITTKKVNDPARSMLTLLLQAHASQKDVQLWITDSATHTAYPGRCSLQIVNLLPL
ncbi:hypothetical protein C8R34_1622 [Nitrosomonas sp. Nm84]|uniref:hypothetical protein n=1 Tax=Nitrosomonas sp. Nm84 TaxID=200124 RepID=UPI000D76D9A3|nr:hypothetical protein [Nitrosomonas sp. Nm84]PXW79688.1 hypothetical protein C8R34_1622 [Nitrosomonas sp. Nm84]